MAAILTGSTMPLWSLGGVAAAASATAPLRRLASPRGIRIGAAVSYDALVADADYRRVLRREFNIVTPENAMKWGPIHPERDRYDFEAADRIVAEARMERCIRTRTRYVVVLGGLLRREGIAVPTGHAETFAQGARASASCASACCDQGSDATLARVHADGGAVAASITPHRPHDVPIGRRRCQAAAKASSIARFPACALAAIARSARRRAHATHVNGY